MSTFRVALAQISAATGDYTGIEKAVTAAIDEAHRVRADLLVTPAMLAPGPHARDLTADPLHQQRTADLAARLSHAAGDRLVLAFGHATADGAPALRFGSSTGASDVGGTSLTPRTLLLNNVPVTVAAGWLPETDRDRLDPRAKVTVIAGADPFHTSGPHAREAAVAAIARSTGTTVVWVNAVGGHDGLLYAGRSAVIRPDGTVIARARTFEDDLLVVDIPVGDLPNRPAPAPADRPPRITHRIEPALTGDTETYTALTRGLRDYVHNNGFTTAVLGLSGGVDSALVACLAADALGPANVLGITMPGPYSSPGSVTDAEALAAALNIPVRTAPVTDGYQQVLTTLADLLDGPGADIARENAQSRLRALHLMSVANARGSLLLNTGNKSEAAVGYFTLGGDGMGALAVIGDLTKGRVYDLCRWRNAHAEAAGKTPPVPRSTMTKAPSAELAPGQQDSNTLPPYDDLDLVVTHLTERGWDRDGAIVALTATGRSEQDATTLVADVENRIARTEHKRKVAPPAIRVTRGAFGHDLDRPATLAPGAAG